MSQIVVNSNTTLLFVALEDSDTGNQILASTPHNDRNVWLNRQEFVGGTALNILADAGDDNLLFLYGHMGADLQIQKYNISGDSLAPIGPVSQGVKVCNTLSVCPWDTQEIVAGFDDGIVYHTTNGGSSWAIVNNIIAGPYSSIKVFWKGDYYPFSAVLASGAIILNYTVNEFQTIIDKTGPNLGAGNGTLTAIDASELV